MRFYEDHPEGTMDGVRFVEVVLRPGVRFASDVAREALGRLHECAHEGGQRRDEPLADGGVAALGLERSLFGVWIPTGGMVVYCSARQREC